MAPGPRRLPGAFQRRELLPLPGGDARCGCGAASAGTERPGSPSAQPDGSPTAPPGCAARRLRLLWGSGGGESAERRRLVPGQAVGRWEAGCPGAFEPPALPLGPPWSAESPGAAPGLLRQKTGLRRRQGKLQPGRAHPSGWCRKRSSACRPGSGGGRWRVGDEINRGLRWLKGEPFGGGGDAARFE